MTTNQGILFAAPAAIEIRRRPCCSVDVATHTVAVLRAGGGYSPGPQRSDTDGETRADRDVDRRAQRLCRDGGQGHEIEVIRRIAIGGAQPRAQRSLGFGGEGGAGLHETRLCAALARSRSR